MTTMAGRRCFAVLCSVCLLSSSFGAPAPPAPFSRGRRADAVADNEVTSKELTIEDSSDTTTTTSPITSTLFTEDVGRSDPETSPPSTEFPTDPSSPPPTPTSSTNVADEDDDDDEDFGELATTSGGGGSGSNLGSLLSLAGSLFPSSSGGSKDLRKMIKTFLIKNQHILFAPIPRKDDKDIIKIDYYLKPPKAPQPAKFNVANIKLPNFTNMPKPLTFMQLPKAPQSTKVNIGNITLPNFTNLSKPSTMKFVKPMKLVKPIKPIRQEIEEDESDDEESNELSDENDASEESMENNEKDNDKDNEKDGDEDEDYDSDEPPGGGDGQGGGLLGLLAGLSGGEDGQSDLGSLLATVGGIVANLSGDGFDLSSLIATALGLFVGLLSEGNENPGTVIANYLLTSLDTITEGGAENNGAFFGNFISRLVKGTSAIPPGSDEDEDMMKMPMADSAGFFASFLSALLGEMSKGSSSGWR